MRELAILGCLLAGMLSGCGADEAVRPGESAADRALGETVADVRSAGVEASGERSPGQDLPTVFDCVRDAGGLIIAAHRGGPGPGYPENALETLQRGLEAGLNVFEVDVAESRDGVLFLMHDRTLGRTTTGNGPVVDADWADIAATRLRDRAGTATDFAPPRLTDVLLWAVENDVILELDRKPSTSFRNIVSAVRAAGAQRHVILITYNDNDVGQLARHAPDMMLTASAFGARDIRRLEQLGIERENLIAWTGTSEPDAAAFARLRAAGVEPAFGTLGRPGERLDDIWLADSDASEFEALVEDGLVLLATDAPLDVANALQADDIAATRCLR